MEPGDGNLLPVSQEGWYNVEAPLSTCLFLVALGSIYSYALYITITISVSLSTQAPSKCNSFPGR